MPTTALRRRIVTTLALAMLVPTSAGVASAAGASAEPGVACSDPSLPITVEEGRLDNRATPEDPPVAEQVLDGTGFDTLVRRFTVRLCDQEPGDDAMAFVRRQGSRLWAAATARAQTDDPAGSLPATDDRGLYWARVSMARAINQWDPAGGLSAGERERLTTRLELTSRGITSSRFAVEEGVEQVIVTGFDPFTLDQDIRIGNPSGATALPLDGARWTVDGREIEIQTMVFPVRYRDFDLRMVERALGRHYRPGPQRADLVTTASQGRVGIFDLEVWNGRRRSVSSIGDNNNVQGGGSYTNPVVPPGMPDGPEFLRSSLPMKAMAKTSVAPFTTRINTRVVEIPAGGGPPVVQPDGPSDDSIAVEGSGGGYLSNEIAYRNTLRREMLAPRMPAGHLHVPVLQFAGSNPDDITDPTYEANRTAIVTGAHKIIRNGIRAIG